MGISQSVIVSMFSLLPACAAAYAAPDAGDCSALSTLQLPHAEVTSAQSVPAGPVTGGSPSLRAAVTFCRVAVTIKPSDDSDIRAEIWLPAKNWNGKFQGIGNGGFAGSIDFNALAGAVARGYAAAATDTGHHAGGLDASWALNHPEKIADYGYRAIHETAEVAKGVIFSFYDALPKHSYFNSCSNGGRQGLIEAQRYPADYDGILAGAPANDDTHLNVQFIFDAQAVAGAAPLTPKLPAIQSAALEACDALDGVKDGVIENPAQCRFDPAVLLCKGAETNACLTETQVAAVRKIYAGPKTSKGEQLMPGFAPGGEADAGDWAAWITGAGANPSEQSTFATNFYKYMVEFTPSTVDQNAKTADEKMAQSMNATDPDLKKFTARGGKLILYHGWSDAAIPPQNTIDYYRAVVKRMGAKEAASAVRLFMVPGMGHCGGGSGPNVFGQNGVPRTDPDHDIEAALERWVEQGGAPEQVVASKMKTGTPPVTVRTRPLCAYPQTAHWKGTGSTDDASNFVCK